MFGDNLRYIRKRNRLSMDALAERYNKQFQAKLNKSTISRYENNLQQPRAETVRRLAEMFGITVDYLVKESRRTNNGT